MGFNLLAFAGGVASGISEDIDKEEKLAKERGTAAAKTLFETYKKTQEENVKEAKALAEDMQFLKMYDPNASPEHLADIARNKAFMSFIKERVKKEDFDATTFKVADFAKFPTANTTATALKYAESQFALPKAAKEIQAQQSSGNFIRDMIERRGNRAEETALRSAVNATGVSVEEMQATINRRKTPVTSTAEIDMGYFTKEKSFDQREKDAKLALLKATQSGDPSKIRLAEADIAVLNTINSKMSDSQKVFANKVADIKNRYMFGSPEERAAAKPEYDKLMADLRSEAAAKKAGEGKEDKIPALGTLNTFTSAAVARKVAEIHGDLVRSKQLAIIEKPDGSSSLEYTGDNQAIRKQINQTAYNAAKNALSLYTLPDGKGMSRDVDAVLNTYKPTDMSLPVDQPEKPAAAPTSTPAPKTKAEYDAIPKGTRYIDTDGKTKIKG